MILDATNEWIIKGAHLTIIGRDVHFCKVNKISIVDASEDDYRYKDFIYDDRRDDSPKVAGTGYSSNSYNAFSDDDLSDDEEED